MNTKRIRNILFGCAFLNSMIGVVTTQLDASAFGNGHGKVQSRKIDDVDFSRRKLTKLERDVMKSGQELLQGKIEAVITDSIKPEGVMGVAPARFNYLFKNVEIDYLESRYSTAFVYNSTNNAYVLVFDYKKEAGKDSLKKIGINGKDYGIVYEIFDNLLIREYFAERKNKGIKESEDQEVFSREWIKPFEELFKGFQDLKAIEPSR